MISSIFWSSSTSMISSSSLGQAGTGVKALGLCKTSFTLFMFLFKERSVCCDSKIREIMLLLQWSDIE